MTATPQPMIVGSKGGWSIALTFRDVLGNPIDLGTAGPVPFADFYQPNLGLTTSCQIIVTDAASGQAVALVPQGVVLSTLQPPPPNNILIGGASTGPAASVCRLVAYVVDSQGTASGTVVGLVQPIDPRTADPAAIPAFSPLAVGPSGAAGVPGAAGMPGLAGSTDPQPVTYGGAVTQHEVIDLAATGALPASSDQPAEAGLVLGLALDTGAVGAQGHYTATGIVTDMAWNWGRGPLYVGIGGGLTQQAPTAGYVQEIAVMVSPTSIRVGLRRPVRIDVPAGVAAATHRDLDHGTEVLRAAASGPGTLIATDPDGSLPAELLGVGAVGAGKLAGGPHLAGLPNGCFEGGLDGWALSTVGTGEVSIDPATSAVGRQSVYLHCPAAADVATLASSPVPCGEGVPVYVAARALLRSGVVLAVLSALFYDRNGAAIGAPVPVGAPLAATSAYVEFGGYVLPPVGARYAAVTVSNTAVAGAVGAINVDEVMLQRQTGGPAAWQVSRVAGPALAALGGAFENFRATLGEPGASDGIADYVYGGVPAPIGGVYYGALSAYLQSLGLSGVRLAAQLVAIWGAAGAVLPMPAGAAPSPAIITGKTAQVINAVKPVLVARGGKFSGFLTNYTDPDAADKSWTSVYVDETAPIGGDLYTRLLSYLTDPAPGLSQPHDQSVADLVTAWAAAPAITS